MDHLLQLFAAQREQAGIDSRKALPVLSEIASDLAVRGIVTRFSRSRGNIVFFARPRNTLEHVLHFFSLGQRYSIRPCGLHEYVLQAEVAFLGMRRWAMVGNKSAIIQKANTLFVP